MPATINLVGQKFGKLKAIEKIPTGTGRYNYICLCECGNKSTYPPYNLKNGNSKQCKDCRGKLVGERSKTHGLSGTAEYKAWKKIKERCYNKKCKEYKYYGGRGIKMCNRWRCSFQNFFSDMGNRPINMKGRKRNEYSIERRNTNKNYTPDNCYWATQSQQSRNRRDSILLTFNGRTMSLHNWADEFGIDPNVVKARYYRGKSVEACLTIGKLRRFTP